MTHDHQHHRTRPRPSWWPEDRPWPPQRSRERPAWWPEDRPWPPRHRLPPRFFRRLGVFFLLLNLLGLALLAGLIALFLHLFGQPPPTAAPSSWQIPLGVIVFLFLLSLVGLVGRSLRRLTIPLDNLLKASEQVGQGDYSPRVPGRGPREIRTLARAFNDMAARLDVLDSQRRDLLADVTHELRTPLTVMQGNLEGMLDGVYPADETHLKAVLEETTILSHLIEDLRTLALAESGALQLKREPTDLGLLLRESASAFTSRADSAGVTIEVHVQQDLPSLELDPNRMRQVLGNLLANALRYTPSGGRVDLGCKQEGDHVLITVSDTGVGIPPDELPHLFERFYKSADSGGMGLGLAIAKKLVEAHRGSISAASTPGQGTTISVNLPLD